MKIPCMGPSNTIQPRAPKCGTKPGCNAGHNDVVARSVGTSLPVKFCSELGVRMQKPNKYGMWTTCIDAKSGSRKMRMVPKKYDE